MPSDAKKKRDQKKKEALKTGRGKKKVDEEGGTNGVNGDSEATSMFSIFD